MTHESPANDDASLADLVKRVGDDTRRLVQAEIALARAELTAKVRVAGIGAGLFGGAAVFGWFGVAVLVAAAVLGLATVFAAWLAALIVGGGLFLIAMVAALIGRGRLRSAQPLTPTQTINSVRDDVVALREAAHR